MFQIVVNNNKLCNMTESRLIEAINESKSNNDSKVVFWSRAENLHKLEKFLTSNGYRNFDKGVAWMDSDRKIVYRVTVLVA